MKWPRRTGLGAGGAACCDTLGSWATLRGLWHQPSVTMCPSVPAVPLTWSTSIFFMTLPIWSPGRRAPRCTRGSGTRPWATCSTGRCPPPLLPAASTLGCCPTSQPQSQGLCRLGQTDPKAGAASRRARQACRDGHWSTQALAQGTGTLRMFCRPQAGLSMALLGSGSRVCGPGGLAAHLPRLLRACLGSVRSSRSRWAGPHVAGGLRMPALCVCGLIATVLAVRTGEHLGRETAPCSATNSGGCLVLGQPPPWLAEGLSVGLSGSA